MNRRPRRSGFVLIVAMVCLLAIVALAASLVGDVADRHRRMRRERDRAQAELIAESALERAAARLLADEDYAGETWRIDAAQLGGRAARAEITVRTDEATGAKTLRATAVFPEGEETAVTVTREVSR